MSCICCICNTKQGESRNTPRDLGIEIAVSAAAWPSSRTTIRPRGQCRGPFYPWHFKPFHQQKSGLPKLKGGDWDDL